MSWLYPDRIKELQEELTKARQKILSLEAEIAYLRKNPPRRSDYVDVFNSEIGYGNFICKD